MRRIITLAAVLFGAGCASSGFDGGDLVPGQSSQAEVEKSMGKVAERQSGAGGETVLWFLRQPYGRVSYAARIGKDGKLVALEQRLIPENLAKVEPGKSTEQEVRAILGPPWRIDPFPRQQRTAWTYAAQGMNPQQYIVQFSSDGIARERFSIDDPDFVRPSAM
jgi:hypothetical protein